MKNSDNLVVVQLKSSDSEYSSVIEKFRAGVHAKEIVKVRVGTCLVLFMP